MTHRDPQNIWFLQTAFLGDCVLSLPLLYELLKSYPKARVRIISNKVGIEMFRCALSRGLSAYAERVDLSILDKRGEHASLLKMRSWVTSLKREGVPDLVFCVQRSFRTGLLALLSGAPVRVGFSSGSAAFCYTHLVARDWHMGTLELEKNLDLLRALKSVDRWSLEKAPSFLAKVPSHKNSEPIVALSLGSPWATKRWPVENALELVHQLTREGVKVWLLGDAAALSLSQYITEKCPSLLVTDYTNKTSIQEWIDLISQASVVVSGDSAAVHVASDLNVGAVSIFGPTIPEFGFAPWRKNSVVLGLSNLPCRPCSIHGTQRCPLEHHRCLKEIRGDRVYRFVKDFLS